MGADRLYHTQAETRPFGMPRALTTIEPIEDSLCFVTGNPDAAIGNKEGRTSAVVMQFEINVTCLHGKLDRVV